MTLENKITYLTMDKTTNTNRHFSSNNNLRHNVRQIFVAIIALLAYVSSAAQGIDVVFADEKNDTTFITNILIEECAQKDRPNIIRIAEKLEGTPYQAATLEGDPETLRVNLQGMDCTTFVETVLALAYTAGEGRESWHDFVYNLRRIRYRNGETNGYPSRLHYISDWILDNSSRGILKEITGELPQARHAVKSLDYMSRHKESYPALADSANLAGIRNVEAGFSNYRYPYIKSSSLNDKTLKQILRDGDIICLTTNTSGLDVTHVAFVKFVNGKPHLLHASQKGGKVMVDPLSIADYLRRYRTDGIRIVRLLTD